jgi:zinc transport system substrate-binding protein
MVLILNPWLLGRSMLRTLCVGLVATLAATSCGGSSDSASAKDGRTDVVAAFYPLAEAARQVGGNDVHVDDLTPAGAEPHDLELTTKQVDALESADVAVVMGHSFQPAVEDAAKRRDGSTVRILDALPIDAAGKQVEEGGSAGPSENGNALDPHVWLDPQLMAKIVDVVAAALVKAAPANAATYTANAHRFTAQLSALDDEIAGGLQHCRRHEIVTSHEAFGWFARRYGLTQHAIAGLSPDEEPSADRIAELSDLARKDGVTTIFTETLVSPKVAQTLAREAGGLKTETLDPLEGLTNAEIKAGAGYVSVMRDNVRALREALGCT